MFKIEMISKQFGSKSYFLYENIRTKYFIRIKDINKTTIYNSIDNAVQDIKFFTEQCKFAKQNNDLYDFYIIDCNTNKIYNRNGLNIQR